MGPFTTLKVINYIAMKLDLPKTYNLYPVVHISYLRKYNPAIKSMVPSEIVKVWCSRKYLSQGRRIDGEYCKDS